jgi:hypothetical protein
MLRIRAGETFLGQSIGIVGEEFTRKRWGVSFARPFDAGEAAKMVYAAVQGIPDIYLTNALFPDLGEIRSQAQLEYEYRVLAPKRVIALGTIAHDACKRAGIPVDAYLAHPQYWRRFKYSVRGEWSEELRRICE